MFLSGLHSCLLSLMWSVGVKLDIVVVLGVCFVVDCWIFQIMILRETFLWVWDIRVVRLFVQLEDQFWFVFW